MSSRSKVWAVAALWLGGCAFSDGEPWGKVELGLEVAFAPDASRLDGTRIKTSNDFRVQLDLVEITIDDVQLEVIPSEPVAVGHDHDHGHEHGEEEEEELVEAFYLVAAGGQVAVALGEVQPVALSCSDCDIEPVATIERVIVSVAWRMRGTVFDARTGDAARLPAEGRAFDLTGSGGAHAVEVDQDFGPGEDIGARIALRLDVAPEIFDGVDFAEASDTALSVGISQGWDEVETVSAETTRFD